MDTRWSDKKETLEGSNRVQTSSLLFESCSYKLKPDHLDPKYYQKMNVPMAFQLFEDRVAASMSIYQEYHPELADCQPTIQFIKRINRLIEVMMSRTPNKALRPGSDKETVITEFLEYLHEWEITAKKNGFYFITESTCSMA